MPTQRMIAPVTEGWNRGERDWSFVKDASGDIVELRCTYDPDTRGGDAKDGRKVKATMHWVSAAHALEAALGATRDRFPEQDWSPFRLLVAGG